MARNIFQAAPGLIDALCRCKIMDVSRGGAGWTAIGMEAP